VHGTPLYAVDSVDGSEKVYTVSKSGYIFALDAWASRTPADVGLLEIQSP